MFNPFSTVLLLLFKLLQFFFLPLLFHLLKLLLNEGVLLEHELLEQNTVGPFSVHLEVKTCVPFVKNFDVYQPTVVQQVVSKYVYDELKLEPLQLYLIELQNEVVDLAADILTVVLRFCSHQLVHELLFALLTDEVPVALG